MYKSIIARHFQQFKNITSDQVKGAAAGIIIPLKSHSFIEPTLYGNVVSLKGSFYNKPNGHLDLEYKLLSNELPLFIDQSYFNVSSQTFITMEKDATTHGQKPSRTALSIIVGTTEDHLRKYPEFSQQVDAVTEVMDHIIQESLARYLVPGFLNTNNFKYHGWKEQSINLEESNFSLFNPITAENLDEFFSKEELKTLDYVKQIVPKEKAVLN